MNWYNRIIKTASVAYMWHGTSAGRMRTILSDGLIPNPKKRTWDETKGERENLISLRSYGGIYLAENFLTAYGAAGNSNSNPNDQRAIIGVKMETQSPSLILDEDTFNADFSPARLFSIDMPYGGRTDFNGRTAFWWASDGYKNIEEMSRQSLFNFIASQKPETEIKKYSRFVENLVPYIVEVMKSRTKLEALIEYEADKKNNGYKTSFMEELENSSLGWESQTKQQAESEYIRIVNIASQKATRLTDITKRNVWTTYRYMEPIRFAGKNKIVFAAVLSKPPDEQKRTYSDIITIHYISDRKALDLFVGEYETIMSQEFLVNDINGNVYYDRPRIEEKQVVDTL